MARNWPEYLTESVLSLRGKGLLAIIDHQRDTKYKTIKNFGLREIAKLTTDSEEEIESSIRELESYGYLQRAEELENSTAIDGVQFGLPKK